MNSSARRLVPLDILFPNHERKQPQKPYLFVKPGVSAKIPQNVKESDAIRQLKVSKLKKDIKSLQSHVEEIENDTEFISNAMAAALQVPQAIENTFFRIHGRIYDIQREIDYAENTLDAPTIKIQRNFRGFVYRTQKERVINAVQATIRRDCAPIYQILIGFLLSYEKRDDDIRLRFNRRFLVRNRAALTFWKRWSTDSKRKEEEINEQIKTLQHSWVKRYTFEFLKKWKIISFSPHSRKNLKLLHQRINLEAQRRVTEKSVSSDKEILELLAQERENIIIEMGHSNHAKLMRALILSQWRKYVADCRMEVRSGNAAARDFSVRWKKKSFFNAWYSLSVGRIVAFGGYEVWHRPQNHRKVDLEEKVKLETKTLKEWSWVTKTAKKGRNFVLKHSQKLIKECFEAFCQVTREKRQRQSEIMSSYSEIMHRRAHRIFSAWFRIVATKGVWKIPAGFLVRHAEMGRDYRVKCSCFYKWKVRFHKEVAKNDETEAKKIEKYTATWAGSINEMKGTMKEMAKLSEKLKIELEKRTKDLASSQNIGSFLENEQSSLKFAVKTLKAEIDGLHSIIGKSSMRYFVELKPIHESVLNDVPAALDQYLKKREEERERIMAEKNKAPIDKTQRHNHGAYASLKRKKSMNVQPKGKIEKSSSNLKEKFRKSVDNSSPILEDIG